MGQHLAAMRAKRAQSQEAITTENPTMTTAAPESKDGDTASSKAVIETTDSGEILLGGEAVDDTPRVSANKGALKSLVSIELVPHQHTLFCERKERVCTASGKLQELEMLKMSGPLRNYKDIVWVRSQSQDGDSASDIPRSEGKDTYQLTAADVGYYISFRVTNEDMDIVTHNGFVGPIVAGPARLLELRIQGNFKIGNVVVAVPTYIGGVEGESEYWWMRINKGKREQVTQPRKIDPEYAEFNSIKAALTSGKDVGAKQLTSIEPGSIDPRMYVLSADDIGCEFKVKCRPVRSDGVRGEIFTSKASPKVEACADVSTNDPNSNTDKPPSVVALLSAESTEVLL